MNHTLISDSLTRIVWLDDSHKHSLDVELREIQSQEAHITLKTSEPADPIKNPVLWALDNGIKHRRDVPMTAESVSSAARAGAERLERLNVLKAAVDAEDAYYRAMKGI